MVRRRQQFEKENQGNRDGLDGAMPEFPIVQQMLKVDHDDDVMVDFRNILNGLG